MAAVRESMGLPGADHCNRRGTALSSPSEPKVRKSGVTQESRQGNRQ